MLRQRQVEMKYVPLPVHRIEADRPAHAFDDRLADRKPRPVPLSLFADELSAWANFSKICSRNVSGMPGPRSLIATRKLPLV